MPLIGGLTRCRRLLVSGVRQSKLFKVYGAYSEISWRSFLKCWSIFTKMSGLSCLCDKYSWCIKSDKFASLECVRNVELSAGIIYHATQARTICTNFIASESQHSGFYNIFLYLLYFHPAQWNWRKRIYLLIKLIWWVQSNNSWNHQQAMFYEMSANAFPINKSSP